MDVVDEWDGRRACALQDALRMTGEEFAERLGTAVRTVRDWHRRPDMKPRQQQQQALDTLLERAPESARVRFHRSLAGAAPGRGDSRGSPQPQALSVAVAVVVTDDNVLLVCRRDSDAVEISWQFPAGVVKPGSEPRSVAIRETLAETGVHCVARERLGRRLHPVTGVYCEYYLCDYLAGEPENKDPVENVSVMWVSRREVTRFISEDQIYRPVLHALMERDDEAVS